jgi:glycosyltransferase involved in cell wall biosynthesis
VWHFRRRIPDGVLRGLYAAATCVLAQSGIEPFGLVGLEVMAQGGTVMVGATGEDYARHGRNALVAETAGAAEVAHLVRRLESDPALDRTLRRHARQTARLYAWRQILPEMLDRTLFAWGEG